MKRKKLLIITFLFILLAGGLYAYSEYTRTNKDLLNEASLFEVDAHTLINAYEKDSTAFNQKYLDKVITVKGTVTKVDNSDNPVVIALGTDGEFSTIQCSMDSTHAAAYANAKEGQSLTIKGICTGARTEEIFGTDVILNRSVVVIK